MAKTPRKQPKPKSPRPGRAQSWFKRTFSHRHLVATEALLVVGVCDRLGRLWVLEQAPAPNWAKVLIYMGFVVGIFGGVLLLLHRVLTTSVNTTHEVVKALPLPTPMIFIHLAAFVGLFFLYAWALGLIDDLGASTSP